jgi:hypothetical protein
MNAINVISPAIKASGVGRGIQKAFEVESGGKK